MLGSEHTREDEICLILRLETCAQDMIACMFWNVVQAVSDSREYEPRAAEPTMDKDQNASVDQNERSDFILQ